MKTGKDVLKSIKDNDVKYVDLRFTDPRGKWQHVTFDIGMIDEDIFAEGTMFDGSSIAGWKAINESDMCLMPDPVTATIDPFFAETTLVITCDVLEPTTGEPYNRDPRGMAKKAEAMVKTMGVGDTVSFGPEAEFFVFDDVRYQTTPYNTGFKLDSSELPIASAQHELGMKFDALTLMADQMQIYKYCIHQVAHIYGKTATFMPKPVYGDNGSGMHCHQSIWKGGKPLFGGIKNKLNPGEPIDKDLYDLPPKELKKIPTVCGSLREALSYLDKDRGFLKAGGVFDDDFIDSYTELKMQEIIRFEHTPHPVE